MTRTTYPEEPLPDRTPEPAEGERQRYALPDEYGPARPARGDDHNYEDLEGEPPAVTVHAADEPTPIEVTAAAEAAEVAAAPAAPVTGSPTDPPPPPEPEIPAPPRSRREIREQREREQAAAKSSGKSGKKQPPRSTRSKWIRRGVAIAVVILLIPVAVSYVHYIQRPGSDTLSVKTVEWIRDHGGNGVVNTIERWWYTNNPPPTGGKPSAIKVPDTVTDTTAKPHPTGPPPTYPKIQHLAPPTGRVPTPATVVEANEGVWQPTGRLVLGQPAVYTTFVRPDAVHTSYYTGLMWLDTKLLRANYIVGTEQPGGGANPWGSQIPESERDVAIAAFNSGFKMETANGGAYLDGQEIVPLRADAASLVINQDGSANVGMWGRDFTMSPDIKAVRQNLVLIVDNGQLNPQMQENDTTAFGATLGNKVYVWRSGVGVTADGALVYAGGPAMSIIA